MSLVPPPDREAAPPDPTIRRPRSRRRRILTWVAAVFGGLTLLSAVGLTVAIVVVIAALSSWEGCTIDVGRHPGKGTASLRLPVTVGPRTGLTDGQVVLVTSDAFTPHSVVGVAMCLREADTARKGVDACDTTSGVRFATDAQGALAAAFPVPRVITLAGTAHDCAAEAERCLVVAADTGDYDVSGGQAVTFAPDLGPADLTPAGPRPKSDLLPVLGATTGPVAPGTEIEVTATGFLPGEPVLIASCSGLFPHVDAWDACDARGQSAAMSALSGDVSSVTDHARPDGSFTATVPAPRRVESFTGTVTSCHRPDACGIVIAAAADFKRSAFWPITVE